MAEDKSKDSRSKNWTLVLYPDSAPANWQAILDDLNIEYVVSPLHDKDLNPNGEPKKPHYHLLLMYGGVKSYEQVIEMIEPFNCPIPKRVHNSRSLVRYMVHLDNPDKAQYNIADIQARGGVDIAELMRPSSSERYSLIKEMMEYIKDNCVIEYQDLFEYAASERFDDWFPLLCDNSSIVMTSYINSKRHKLKSQVKDLETGEISYR